MSVKFETKTEPTLIGDSIISFSHDVDEPGERERRLLSAYGDGWIVVWTKVKYH